MNCTNCGTELRTSEDIHWLDEFMVCSDCYERAVDDSREVTPGDQND